MTDRLTDELPIVTQHDVVERRAGAAALPGRVGERRPLARGPAGDRRTGADERTVALVSCLERCLFVPRRAVNFRGLYVLWYAHVNFSTNSPERKAPFGGAFLLGPLGFEPRTKGL